VPEAALPGSPTHISTDLKGRFIFSGSYNAGCVSVTRLNDGIPGEMVEAVEGLEGCHSANISPDNKTLWVPALKQDRICLFTLGEDGKLTAQNPAEVTTVEGAGPRHMVFHPNLECQADTFCVTIQYRQGITSLLTRAQRAQTNGSANQCPGLVAMNALQLFQINLTSFRFQIQRLTAAHARNTAGHRQLGDHRQAIAVGHFSHWRIAQNSECQRLQGIARQNGIRFAKLDVTGWLPAAQIVIIHRR
jgi:hypothetical protein